MAWVSYQGMTFEAYNADFCPNGSIQSNYLSSNILSTHLESATLFLRSVREHLLNSR